MACIRKCTGVHKFIAIYSPCRASIGNASFNLCSPVHCLLKHRQDKAFRAICDFSTVGGCRDGRRTIAGFARSSGRQVKPVSAFGNIRGSGRPAGKHFSTNSIYIGDFQMSKDDDFVDLSTEARLAVQLAKAGALDNALGFLARRIRNEFGTGQDGLDLVIAELRSQTPQCFEEAKPDVFRTKKLVEAMPSGNDELMSGLANAFAERKRNAEAMKQSQRR